MTHDINVRTDCFTFVSLRDMASGIGHEHRVRFPHLYETRSSWAYASPHDLNVVVPASFRSIQASVPDSWLEGTTDLDSFFNPKNDLNLRNKVLT